jgi:hypothetical protein
MVYNKEKITLKNVKNTLQAVLHLHNKTINIENGGQSISFKLWI